MPHLALATGCCSLSFWQFCNADIRTCICRRQRCRSRRCALSLRVFDNHTLGGRWFAANAFCLEHTVADSGTALDRCCFSPSVLHAYVVASPLTTDTIATDVLAYALSML
jgi:hypothetical protein